MNSTRWWKETGLEQSPFNLPQAVAEQLRMVRERDNGDRELKYLWVYFSHDGIAKDASTGVQVDRAACLTKDGWLNVLDEAASLGISSVILCVTTELSRHPELWEIVDWAESTHNMHVGLHLCGTALDNSSSEMLKKLDRERTSIFLDDELTQHANELRKNGFAVSEATLAVDPGRLPCSIPEDMVCIGPDGRLYTCGLVLGNEDFYLGHAMEERMASAVQDKSKPHIILEQERICSNAHGCDGCPPFMIDRIRKD